MNNDHIIKSNNNIYRRINGKLISVNEMLWPRARSYQLKIKFQAREEYVFNPGSKKWNWNYVRTCCCCGILMDKSNRKLSGDHGIGEEELQQKTDNLGTNP